MAAATPSPVKKRKIIKDGMSHASAFRKDEIEKTRTKQFSAVFLPIRSDSLPPMDAPKNMPRNDAAVMSAMVDSFTPQCSISAGATLLSVNRSARSKIDDSESG